MEDGADCLDAFGIDELLDFSHDNEVHFSHDDSTSMQALSAASSDSAEEFINSNSGLSSLMDSRSFCPPELGWFDFDNAKVLLGSSAREEEKNRMRSQQQEEQLYMMSPVSVLESCATSERPAMVSISSVHAGDGKNVSPSTTKRGRPITSTVRTSYSASSDEEVEDEEEEEEEDDDDDDDGDVELDEEEEDDDEEEEEEEEEEGSDEQSEIHGSDCALSTESEVVTEEDDGFRPPPAKRQCYEQFHHHHYHQQQQRQQQRQNQHQSYQQSQEQNCQEISLRKCSHCQTQKTPQWRAGPLGPKTLCNACGVRFKSGRLLPEYRPAGSPSFVSDKHSNSHRKVLEMRRQREMDVVKKLKAEAEAEGEIAEETAMLRRVG